MDFAKDIAQCGAVLTTAANNLDNAIVNSNWHEENEVLTVGDKDDIAAIAAGLAADKVTLQVITQAKMQFGFVQAVQARFDEKGIKPYALMRNVITIVIERNHSELNSNYIVFVRGRDGKGDWSYHHAVNDDQMIGQNESDMFISQINNHLINMAMSHLLMTNDQQKEWYDIEHAG